MIAGLRCAALSRRTATGVRRPITNGTGTAALPIETSSVTVERRATLEPDAGSWPNTVPGANVLERKSGRETRPVRLSFAVAARSCNPITRGTATVFADTAVGVRS